MKLAHGRVEVHLHPLSDGEAGSAAPPLLLLHELGSSSRAWPDVWHQWPGEVHALDFSGHGESGRAAGSGYYPEYFVAEADLALAALDDRICVVGAGIGAYVGLLLAGARPMGVEAAALLPGRGFAGGGAEPDPDSWWVEGLEAAEARWAGMAADYLEGTDPGVHHCEEDLRPPDYVAPFAAAARRLLFAPLAPDADEPPWWKAAREAGGAGAVEGEQQQVYRVNLRKVLKGRGAAFELAREDTIWVPRSAL